MSAAAEENDDAAARWAIRLDGEPLREDEERALDAWLEGEPRRRGALLRAEAALAYLDRGRALAEPVVPIYNRHFGRRAFLIGGSVSGLAALSVGGFFWSTRPRAMEIETAIGEVRRVPLADGSVASVNTNSKVAVALQDHRRQVQLEDGEAWFQVAHDKSRPFVVEAGDVRVQAVGTAFSVRRRENGADVLVTEGVVEVWTVGHEGERTRVGAGSKTFVADGVSSITAVSAGDDIDRALAWRTGELALNGESLDYAAAEFNRYNTRKIVIENPALGRETLVGYFRTDQPESFARNAAHIVGGRVEFQGDTIVIKQ